MADEIVASMLELAEQWQSPLSREGALHLAAYFIELLRWNERVNLTGARELDELVGEHLPDSFALAKLCPRQANLVDIGSGGGLPTIPFSILRPDCRVTLVEPRAKRVAFLNTAARSCGSSSLTIVRSRMEELRSSAFSVATSRATFAPHEWLAIAPRLLSAGGTAVVFAANVVTPIAAAARLAEEVSYSTARGAPRWCAAFCFT